jgi:general secretion pathway protein D
MHDQRDARSLTEDLKAQLPNAAAVNSALNSLPPTGVADPQRRVRRRLGLEP